MTEFLKGYAAGANDMEAGRLVTKNSAVDFAVAQVRDRDLVIESLRETNRMLDLARRDQKTRAEAAEAKAERLRKELADANR